MKPTAKTILLTALATALMACQNNGYNIEGTVEGLQDGDSIVITTDMADGQPLLKTVVTRGTFQATGMADSTMLCAVYVASRPDINTSFFLEPGNISIHLAQQQEKCKVAGTKVNNAWQQLNNTIAGYTDKMQQLAAVFYDQQQGNQARQQAIEQLQNLEGEMVQKIVEAAENNLDNEMGYYIVTHFADDNVFTPARRLSLIEQMPQHFRNRPAAIAVRETAAKMQQTEKGSTIADFAMATPEGDTLSVMDVVRGNRLTILDFWASWCAPCRQEMPNMVSLYAKYQPKGLAIIGISLDEKQENWKEAIRQMNMTWPQISDLKGWQSEAAQMFQVKAIPHVIIVDSKGTIVEKGLRGQQLEQFMEENLK